MTHILRIRYILTTSIINRLDTNDTSFNKFHSIVSETQTVKNCHQKTRMSCMEVTFTIWLGSVTDIVLKKLTFAAM